MNRSNRKDGSNVMRKINLFALRPLVLVGVLAFIQGLSADVLFDPTSRAVSLANTTAAMGDNSDMYANPACIGSLTGLGFVAGYNIHFPGVLPQGQEIMDFHVSVLSPLITVKRAVLSTVGITLYNRPLAGVYELLTFGLGTTFNFGKLQAFRNLKIQDLILGVRVKIYDASYKYNGELGVPPMGADLKKRFDLFNTDVGLQAQLFTPGLWLGAHAQNILPFGYGTASNNLISSPLAIEGSDVQIAIGGRYDVSVGKFVVLTPAADFTILAPPVTSTSTTVGFGGRGALEANFLDLIFLRLGASVGSTETFNMGFGMGLHLQMDKFVADVDLSFKWLPTMTDLGTSIQTLAINVNARL